MEVQLMATKWLDALTAALYEVARFELRRRLTEIARTDPTAAREITHVDGILGYGSVDDLPADWCKRLSIPVRAANRRAVLKVEKKICDPLGEPFIERDRVEFDQELREGAPGGDAWLDVALVYPSDLPSYYRCWISTRFALSDKRVSSIVAQLQHRWSERFGAHFFKQGEAKPYVYSPLSGEAMRVYGAKSRYKIARDVGKVHQYLSVIADAWDWQGSDPEATSRAVEQSLLDNAPPLALELFAGHSKGAATSARIERPALTATLIRRVGQALGYVSASGMRQAKGKARPAHGEIDRRLLPLIAKILAQKHGKSAATLLRTVVRPALLDHAFTGLVFKSAERFVRPRQPARRPTKRSRTLA
jgi:hypothetical protein